MTQGVSERRTRWSVAGLFATAAFALTLSPATAAPPSPRCECTALFPSMVPAAQPPSARSAFSSHTDAHASPLS